MAFQIVSSPNINITNAIALGVGYNSFDPIYITIDQAVENFKNLLLTRKGERLIHVTFGCDLTNIVFQPNVSELKEEIKNIITDDVSYWLPYINNDVINIVTAEDDPSLPHHLKVSLTISINDFDTRTITFNASEDGQLEIEE